MEPVYEVHGLCKYYGKKAALDGVDFTVEPGKLVGLLGPNGSGKTTLIKIFPPGCSRPTAAPSVLIKHR